jgi:transposase
MTTKLHLAITPEGYVVEGMLTGGNIADISVADCLMENVSDCYVIEDKGYDSDKHRANLRSNNNIPVIPGRKNRKQPVFYDKSMYKIRRNVEILFGKIKENRRLAMRFDKADAAFLAFIALALIKIIIS